MSGEKQPKRRRARGSGSVYRIGSAGPWWIAYRGPDGRRHAESSGSLRKGDAQRLLERRVGARENNLPVIPRAEKLTFDDAAQAVVNDFKVNGKRSLGVVQRRIAKHLTPYFGGRRLVGITATDVTKYIAHRQAQGIVAIRGPRKDERTGDVSNAEINRELQTLKRVFSLAIESGRIAMKPHIAMLQESSPRSGFFEPEQLASVLRHLPTAIRPVIQFAGITGWRIASEVLPLEWRQVDFRGGEIRLDAGTTKNGKGRVFPMTTELRALLQTQRAEHTEVQKAGHITPFVFFRLVAKGRGGDKHPRRITAFGKAWKAACVAAGCPGRYPHDLRRSAIRGFVRAGLSEHVAMKLSGHLTPSVFRRYDIVSGGDLVDAARKLDSAANSPRRQARS